MFISCTGLSYLVVMMQTRRGGGRGAHEVLLVLLGLCKGVQRRQTLGNEL